VAAPLRYLRRLLLCLGGVLAVSAGAAPVDFNVPAQPAPAALLAFSQQARVEVLFSYDELSPVTANAVHGKFEPEDALNRLLRDTGFAARRSLLGKFVVARAARPTGAVAGRVLAADGTPARDAIVALAGVRLRTTTDATGHFLFPAVPPGDYRLFAGGHGYRVVEFPSVVVTAGETRSLPDLGLQAASEVTELEPYLVKDRDDRLLIGEGVGAAPRRAAGNLDLPRTEDNALPFTIFTREQIARSGVVQLNEFFQRELLDGAANPPPEQNGSSSSFVSGSSNLGLRGYGSDETVVLVNGRRLPETFTDNTGVLGAPDVNLVPLSLVQQVEVLPVSASALYSGNAVGGVINIVLLPDSEGTEVRTTYTNTLGGYDAPQSSVSLQHGRNLLGGRVRLRVNGTFTRTEPAVESELNYQYHRLGAATGLAPRATPNVESADDTPLFGAGSATFTSVAPGADGNGGIAAFGGRGGVRSTELFDTPGGLASSFNSRDYLYGRQQRRAAWYGSAVYDATPWLQLGLDASYAATVVHRGYDLFAATLALDAGSPFNPFGQDVNVALNETAARLGEEYNEARLRSWSVVGGALLKLPGEWQLSFDGQYARNVARYRGVIRADPVRWQELVDAGGYNPLRDTQRADAPAAFYDRVLVYYGGPGRFVTLGEYDTFEGTVRATNEALALPTGKGTANVGADYRLSRLAPYTSEPRYADGTPAPEVIPWSGRTLERMSVFGELQAPLLPARWLPRPVKSFELDLGLRYIVSAQANETSLAPTIGLKADLAGGFALRGSYTTSNRFPTPVMSRPLVEGSGSGSGADPAIIFDPRRNESYVVDAKVAINPNVRPESAATQSAGLVWQHGTTHRFRASLDFADTTKTNEFIVLKPQDILNLEGVFPDRIERGTPAPGSPPRVSTVLVGPANAAHRHSQNWSAAVDYAWRDFAGGTLSLRGRWVWFQKYDRQLLPGSPEVDELNAPDAAFDLLRHRVTFSAGWANPKFGFGFDAHYLGARILPAAEWPAQGSDRIKSYWQLDGYVQADLTRWLPGRPGKFRLNAQLRVNNLSNYEFPKYVNDASGSGVQAYGDWRGRTYSFSTTLSF
jgi:outer membrane receptor protein involved in Fe transport